MTTRLLKFIWSLIKYGKHFLYKIWSLATVPEKVHKKEKKFEASDWNMIVDF